MTEYKISRHHRTATEFCYTKQNGAWLLYNDTALPRVLIATISGSDLDGWAWRSETAFFKPCCLEENRYGRWGVAMYAAVLEYIKAEYANQN